MDIMVVLCTIFVILGIIEVPKNSSIVVSKTEDGVTKVDEDLLNVFDMSSQIKSDVQNLLNQIKEIKNVQNVIKNDENIQKNEYNCEYDYENMLYKLKKLTKEEMEKIDQEYGIDIKDIEIVPVVHEENGIKTEYIEFRKKHEVDKKEVDDKTIETQEKSNNSISENAIENNSLNNSNNIYNESKSSYIDNSNVNKETCEELFGKQEVNVENDIVLSDSELEILRNKKMLQ